MLSVQKWFLYIPGWAEVRKIYQFITGDVHHVPESNERRIVSESMEVCGGGQIRKLVIYFMSQETNPHEEMCECMHGLQ